MTYQETEYGHHDVRNLVELRLSEAFRATELSTLTPMGMVFDYLFETIQLFNPFYPQKVFSQLDPENQTRVSKKARDVMTYIDNAVSYSRGKNPDHNRIVKTIEDAPKIFDSVQKALKNIGVEPDGDSMRLVQNISAQQEIDQNSLQIRQNLSYSDSILKQMRTSTGLVAQEIALDYFLRTAKSNSTASWIWTAVTLLNMATIIGFALYGRIFIPFSISGGIMETAHFISTKIVIIATLGAFLIFCLKNALGYRHNSIINYHRNNSILTFQGILESTDDEKTREIIIHYAANSIFSPQDSAFVRGSTQHLASPLPNTSIAVPAKALDGPS